MSGTWPKVIRDPVHDLITFEDTPCDRLLLALIGTKEFQRLRRIKQLGMSELVFPGATHSRFAHSLGVMNMARKFLDRLDRVSGERLSDEQRIVVMAASLIHDVGHGPFSHTFEKVTGEKHERRTIEIIADPSTEVHQRLKKHSRGLPGRLVAFFEEDVEDVTRGAKVPAYLLQVVSSQLDADRFDYLLRDSHASGTDYGRFDSTWLIEHLHYQSDPQRFYLSHKALLAAEAYIFARYHMYRIVYFHKTTRAAEVMLRLVFKRFKELLDKAKSAKGRVQIAPDAPPAVVAAFGGTMPLSDYLALDDAAVYEFLKACRRSSDAILRDLGGGLLDRRLYKAVEASEAAAPSVGEFTAPAMDLVRQSGLDPDYTLVADKPADTPYEPYDPDEEKPASQIYVETTLGQVREISKLSGPVEQLRKKYSLLRYYYPNAMRAKMEKLAAERLKKE